MFAAHQGQQLYTVQGLAKPWTGFDVMVLWHAATAKVHYWRRSTVLLA